MYLRSFRRRDWQFLFTYGVRAIRRVRQHIFNLTRNAGAHQAWDDQSGEQAGRAA
jgi:hypothetical protein